MVQVLIQTTGNVNVTLYILMHITFHAFDFLLILSIVCVYIYSTKSMRNDGGYNVIRKAIENLGLRHKEHISAYGEGNERRLTGRHETADINTFKWVSYKHYKRH